MTYVLHYAPDNASMIIRIALEELSLPYETVLVDRSIGAQFSKEHRALNPAGRIPVLITPHGPIFETAAILLWLSEQHAGLLPPVGDAMRAQALSWLLYMSNDLQSLMRVHFYTERFVDEAHILPIQSGLEQTFLNSFDLLEKTAQSDGFFLSDTPSALDCYLGPILRWAVLYPRGDSTWFDLSAFPKLARIARLLELRPSMQRIAAAEGLGATPFSNPDYSNPPEGVAH